MKEVIPTVLLSFLTPTHSPSTWRGCSASKLQVANMSFHHSEVPQIHVNFRATRRRRTRKLTMTWARVKLDCVGVRNNPAKMAARAAVMRGAVKMCLRTQNLAHA